MIQIPTSEPQARARAYALDLRRRAFARLWRALVPRFGATKRAAPLQGRPECCG